MPPFADLIRGLRPIPSTFAASLLLSLIAYLGSVTIGKDGALYVDIARTIVDHGLAAGAARFNWIGFPAVLAGLHQLSDLPIETLAYLLCALFMAGTCTLLVDLTLQRAPQATWWIVLVALAMPAFNSFRDDIIREHGFWFFSMLSLWLAYRWQARGGWWRALLVQAAIGGAIVFRLEAVLLEFALVLWLTPSLRQGEGWLRLAQLCWLPLLGVASLLLVATQLSSSRLEYYLAMLSPLQVYNDFQAITQQFAASLQYKYSRDDAHIVVLVGVIGLISVKFMKLLGPFIFPLFSSAGREGLRQAALVFSLPCIAAGLYFVVLLIFFFHEQFVNSRYLSFLNLLLTPLAALALAHFSVSHRKLAKLLLGFALIVMLANVVSFSAKKTHYIEAGRWLAEHAAASDVIYYDEPRIEYYAGFGYKSMVTFSQAKDEPERFRYLMLETKANETWLQDWLSAHQLRILAQFSNRKGETVLAIGR
ncbi:hypothetical protein [Azonexus sp.]|uniref:hypothetical protein n=1 Tax=Azonexus sp. TaxID=1872668 RepID=UPI0039E3002E